MTFEMSEELLKGWRVLVVDDEPDSIEVASTLLEYCGAEVHTANNGRDGLEKINLSHPHFVISDLSMPEMSGWEMIREIKGNRATLDIPVIALTAHAMDGDRRRAIEVGFHNHLTKPLRPESFVNDLLVLLMDVPEIAEKLNFNKK
jgi:CheY-like chemotaxis protein